MYLEKIEGMVFGDSEKSGVRRGNKFYHGPLNLFMSSPKSWEIINTPNRLIFMSPFGEAVLQMTLEDLNFKESPENYLRRFASSTYDDMTLNVNGFEGFTAKAYRTGKETRMAVIFKDDQAYQFLGYSKNNYFSISKFDTEFLNIINSFRNLNPEEQVLSKPLRLKIYKVNEGDSYESLASKSSINTNAEDQLRLINGDYPDKKLEVGRLIKIVQ